MISAGSGGTENELRIFVLSSATRGLAKMTYSLFQRLAKCRGLRVCAFYVLVFLAVGIAPARADVGHYYLNTSCNFKRGVASIKGTLVYNDDPAPPNAIYLGDIGGANVSSQPVEICNIGKMRSVSISIIMNGDHPRDSHIDVSIGHRPPMSVYEFPVVMTFKYLPTSYFVFIKQCSDSMICSEKNYTNPSFDCHDTKTRVEMLICSSDRLSELDAYLGVAWNNVTRVLRDDGKPPGKLVADERKWLKSRDLACNVGSNYNAISPYFAPDILEDCLAKMYRKRIDQLQSLN